MSIGMTIQQAAARRKSSKTPYRHSLSTLAGGMNEYCSFEMLTIKRLPLSLSFL